MMTSRPQESCEDPAANRHRGGASQIRMLSKRKKPIGERMNQPVGSLSATALPGDVIPNVVQLDFDLRRKAVRHQRGLLVGSQTHFHASSVRVGTGGVKPGALVAT